jgi:hypothetical protein
MKIDFEIEEITLLKDLLSNRLSDLRVEVRRTEEPHYHDQLKRIEERVRAILEKLVHPERR